MTMLWRTLMFGWKTTASAGTNAALHSSWIHHTELTHELRHMFYFIILGLDLNDDHSGLFVKNDAVYRDSVEALLDLSSASAVVLRWQRPVRSIKLTVFHVIDSVLAEKARPPDTGSTTFYYGGLRSVRRVYRGKRLTESVQPQQVALGAEFT